MMKALFFNEKGNAEEVLMYGDIDAAPVPNNEVRVRMLASPINPADFMFIEKQYRAEPIFPQIAGFEGAGMITENGGDHNYPFNSLVAFRHKNVWAESVNVPKNKIVLLPENFPVEKAAQLSLNSLTAWALLEELNAKENDWILLSAGASAVSKLMIQFAKNRNIKTIAIVRHHSQDQELLNLGASAVANGDDEEFEKKIKALVQNGRICGFADAVGGDLTTKVIKVLDLGSTIIHYGLFSPQQVRYHSSDVIFKNLTIKGFGIDNWLSRKSTSEMQYIWKDIIHQVKDRNFQMEVSAKFLLKDYKNAILTSRNSKKGKVLFRWDEL